MRTHSDKDRQPHAKYSRSRQGRLPKFLGQVRLGRLMSFEPAQLRGGGVRPVRKKRTPRGEDIPGRRPSPPHFNVGECTIGVRVAVRKKRTLP